VIKKYEVASWLEDIAGAVKTFKINSTSESHLTGTDERLVSYLKHRTSHFKVLEFQYKTIIGFNVIITLVMLAIGTYLLVDQQLNIGAFIATEIVVLTIMNAVEKLIKSLESYYDVIASLVKLNKVTDLAEEQTGDLILEPSVGGIDVKLDDVSFAFNDNKPILKNITFELKSNTLTVISGDFGAGKSTLLNVMAGFYEPSSGALIFDKVPLKNINKEAWRARIGLYTQDMIIVKGTLMDNILLGRRDLSTEDVIQLSEEIGLENLPSLFSHGFDTNISETDTEVSFSGKKKITLLRALLGNNRLVILEDPLHGMNEEFRARIIKYLQKIKAYTTVVVVSQAQEIISIADQHLTLKNGLIEKH
jgi:ATP-binding cassette subfamily B protein